MQFDPSILANNPQTRRRLLSVLAAALDAVDPYRAVCNNFVCVGGYLQAGGRSYALDRFRQVLILGAGKAGAPMACGRRCAGDRCGGGWWS
ncbi:MAG: DUF4147 domain-containing protein [Anaerolineales bacterium]|nr:DUF4147 domain-containing protein [Anaerolineales bacterium]